MDRLEKTQEELIYLFQSRIEPALNRQHALEAPSLERWDMSSSPSQPAVLTFSELLDLDGICDLKDALAERESLSPESQSQVNLILSHLRFHDWLAGPQPDLLLVDANLPDQDIAVISALSAVSAFSAVLATALTTARRTNRNPHIFVAHFFCGLHASPRGTRTDEWNGPGELVRSLIVQLLSQLEDPGESSTGGSWAPYGLDLEDIDAERFLQDLEHLALPALCLACRKLLHTFAPYTPVYLIVDSVSSFDALGPMLRDLGVVMDMFRQIVNDESMPADLSWREQQGYHGDALV
ncbi:hypothetical protein VTJ83DRAFT_6155 [Remersonia thermophila]|uniref:Uncharacterized protein n=1 Tax=Remersonia thermophila TaxID=72144 RepID=A0ABR4D8Z9_9PEZI